MTTCSVPGCDRSTEAHGLCHSHFEYQRRTGKMPTKPLLRYGPEAAAERFWAKVNKTDTCWLWTGGTDGGGRYGSMKYKGKMRRAHRISLDLAGVEIPDGMVIDHLCRVTLCVRPDHLEVVTQRENVDRGISPTAGNADKTHCPAGHPYSGDNLYIIPSSGGRVCKTCDRATGAERQRRYRERKKAAG